MSKSTKTPHTSLTGSNFHQTYRVLAVPGVPSVPRNPSALRNPSVPGNPSVPRCPAVPRCPSGPRSPSVPRYTSMPRSPTVPSSPSETRSPSDPRSTSDPRSPPDPRSPSGPRTPSGPRSPFGARTPSVPRSPPVSRTPSVLRVPYVAHSIRESNSYGPRIQKYDEYINIFDVSDDSDKDISRRKDCNKVKPAENTKYELKTIHEKNTLSPTKIPSKPILHCYNIETTNKNSVSSPLNVKKSAPIKKISFVLPGCKKPLSTERMNWKDYHKLNVIYQFMDDLEANFPSICTTTTIGKSVEGRELKVLKISNSNASNEAVWIDSGIHAREWIAPAVNTYIANHIIRNFDNLPESVTNKDWYFLPIVNPDGYHYSHSIDRMWRKNRALHNGIRTGVDLNRNFCLGWGRRGSSDKSNNAFYRGPHPFSEPESCAMRDMLMNSGINFKVYLTLHCYGQIIIFPYSFTSEMAPDYVRLLEGASAMSKAIYNTNGNTYKVGVSKDVMYSASGTSNDFAHGRAGIPFCYLIELRSKKHKFKLPKEQIEETGKEILSSVLALMEFIDTYAYQDRVEQNIDLLLENDSFIHSSVRDKSEVKRLSGRNRLKLRPDTEKTDKLTDSQGSFVRLTHIPVQVVDSREENVDNEWSDSVENMNDSVMQKKFSYASKNGDKKNKITKIPYLSDSSESENESVFKIDYTLDKNTDPFKKVNGYLPNIFENRNESVFQKNNTCEKETNPLQEIKESLPDFFNNENESVLKKTHTSEMETNTHNTKVNQNLFSDFNNENEYFRKESNTSEKGTSPPEEYNQYYFDSFDIGNESVLMSNDISTTKADPHKKVNQNWPESIANGQKYVLRNESCGSKHEIDPFKKVNQFLPGCSNKSNESVQKKNHPSKTKINRNKKISENVPDITHCKKESDLKKIYTTERGTNPNQENNQYMPDSNNSEKESDLKQSCTSREKMESFKTVNQDLPGSFNNEKESFMKKNNTSREKTEPAKKVIQYMPGSFDSEKESFIKKNNTSREKTEPSKIVIQYMPDSYDSEKQSFLKKNNTSREKTEPFKKVIQYLADSFDKEKESQRNKISISEKETNTTKKEHDSNDSLLTHYDSFIKKAEFPKVASDATGSRGHNSNSLISKEDSFEAWNNFYERKNNFDMTRNDLLLKTNTYMSADIQWYLYCI